jgi:2,3,4,5-tetrahydropyridine-2,6-dicarboxylate N-succinyltransferase
VRTDDATRARAPHPVLLDDLDAGRRRAAWPDPAAPDGWRVDPELRSELLALFRAPAMRAWQVEGLFAFRDRATLPPKRLLDGEWRVVPGGTSVRAGAYLGTGVVIMPPSYVNVGAWVGDGTMIDSHVLVGSCAQVGARVHLSAGVQVGGVLEPANARPVIVEDDAFIGAQCGLFDGVLIGRGAVLAAGVVLTGTSRLYDLVGERLLEGTPDAPLAVPPDAVVVPATRPARGSFAAAQGIGLQCAAIVKMRDRGTSARTALEAALR